MQMSRYCRGVGKEGNDNGQPYAGATILIWGLKALAMSTFVPATSFGILLTRYAPLRTAQLPAADIPDRFDRIDPASEAFDPGSRNRGGGAKSRAVKVPDLRSMCLTEH